MQAIKDTFPHLFIEAFDIQLMKVMIKKVNSCWEGSVKGFWLKIPVNETNTFDSSITRAKIEISFLKPIEGAQLSLQLTHNYRDYLSDEEKDINDLVMQFHSKKMLNKNLMIIEDLILFKLNIKILDEDFVAKKVLLEQEKGLSSTLRQIQNDDLEERGLEFLMSIAEKSPLSDNEALKNILENKKKFFQAFRDSEDFVINTKMLKAAEEAYIKS